MADERPDTAESEPEELATAADEDGLGGLESLQYDDEGAGLALPDEDLTEDDLNDLFDEDDDGAELGDMVPASRTGREARQKCKQRDRENYSNLEAHLQATPLGLVVSEDKMVVRVSRITGDNSTADFLALLKKEKVVHGIDHEAIRSALAKAETGQNQLEVTVARGKRPKVVKDNPRKLVTEDEEVKVQEGIVTRTIRLS